MIQKSAAVSDEFPKTDERLEYWNLECVFILICRQAGVMFKGEILTRLWQRTHIAYVKIRCVNVTLFSGRTVQFKPVVLTAYACTHTKARARVCIYRYVYTINTYFTV